MRRQQLSSPTKCLCVSRKDPPCRDSLDEVKAGEQLVIEPPHHQLDATGHPGTQAAGVPYLWRIVLDVICAVES